MDIKTDWEAIRKHFNRCFPTNFHVSMASVGADNIPSVTPIGSLFLNADKTAFYFEKYPVKLQKHAGENPKVCILAVNSGRWFWIRSLFRGRFSTWPGIRLYGELGTIRKATDIELSRLKRRMKATNMLRGNRYLWGDMFKVRELKILNAEMVQLGRMTKAL